MEHDERNVTGVKAASSTGLLASAPVAPDSWESDSGDETSASEVQDMVRLLEDIWPHPACDTEQLPGRFGRFLILGELGRGGFGVVYLAEDPLLKRKVALKLPRIGTQSGAQGWRRFLRESQAASRLDHPNVIPLLEAGTIGPVGYIVSAYVAGPSLEQWLRHERTAVSPRWGARIVASLARAIEHAHQCGILHRDLKPANVVLSAPELAGAAVTSSGWQGVSAESWVPRICDFGMAKLREPDAEDTCSRIACGSPSYMAPEQADPSRGPIGPATDVYGLGAILYQILVGRAPFRGPSDLDILRQVVADEPESLRKERPGLARDLETICLKCLAKKPGDRYSSAGELADDLERFLGGRPIRARPTALLERSARWARRHPAAALLTTATAVAVVAGIAGLVWHNTRLEQVNEALRVTVLAAEASEREAQIQKNRAEAHERSLRRQLASRQLFNAQQAFAARDFERALKMLEVAESELGNSAERNFAWSHLRSRIREQFEVFQADPGKMNELVLSPDGRVLASGDSRGVIRLWDLASGSSRALVAENCEAVFDLAFTADGRQLAVASSDRGAIFLWDVASGRLRGALPSSTYRAVVAVKFLNDGRGLAAFGRQKGSGLRPIEFWQLQPDASNSPILDPESDPSVKALVSDRRLRAIAELMNDQPWRFGGSMSEFKRSWVERPPMGFERIPNSVIGLVASGDGGLEVIDMGLRTLVASGRIYSGGSALVVLDGELFKRQLLPHERASIDRLAAALAPSEGDSAGGTNVHLRLGIGDRAVAFSRDGRRLAVWQDGRNAGLRVFDLTTGQVSAEYGLSRPNTPDAMSFTADGSALAFGSNDGKLRLWHLNAPQNPQHLHGHDGNEIWSLSFSPDGRTLASAGDDHTIGLWDVETGKPKQVLRGHQSLVTTVAFSPDSKALASSSFDRNAPVALWDASTGALLSILRGHTARARAISFAPDGRTLVSAGDDRSLIVWDVGRRERRKTLAQEFSAICVVCSPDGGTTVCSTDFDQIVFNDLRTGTRRRLRTGGTQIYSLVYAKDGSRLFSGHADGSIRIWDVATEQQVDTILGHRGFVFGLAMSPDGRTLASGGADGTVRVWDVGSAQETLCLVDCKARVNAVAFSPDGRTLAAADHVGTITIWRSVTRRNGGLITEPEPAHADAAVATRAAVRSLGD